jgi:hypothetical protein
VIPLMARRIPPCNGSVTSRAEKGAEMLADTLMALPSLAANTVVAAATTDAWEAAGQGFARLLGRGDPEQEQLAERRLAETREQLTGAEGADLEQARAALAERWAGRLADLLEEYPDAEADLRTLIQEVQAALIASGYGEDDAYGPEHPETLAARGVLAAVTGFAGDAAGARDQFAALLPIIERVSGPEHPRTLAARGVLAAVTGFAGDAAGARDQYAALLPTVERVSGPEHPETLEARDSLAYWSQKTDGAEGRGEN